MRDEWLHNTSNEAKCVWSCLRQRVGVDVIFILQNTFFQAAIFSLALNNLFFTAPSSSLHNIHIITLIYYSKNFDLYIYIYIYVCIKSGKTHNSGRTLRTQNSFFGNFLALNNSEDEKQEEKQCWFEESQFHYCNFGTFKMKLWEVRACLY